MSRVRVVVLVLGVVALVVEEEFHYSDTDDPRDQRALPAEIMEAHHERLHKYIRNETTRGEIERRTRM